MASINLKKLVLRKELSLIQEIINAIDPSASVQTAEGAVLIGGQTEPGHQRYPITLDGKILGWVTGHDKAGAIANLISQLVHREIEKRTLAQELLSKYKEISLLFNLSERIIDSPDVQEVAALVLEEAKHPLKSSSGALLLFQENTRQLKIIASLGKDPLFHQAVAPGEGIIKAIVETGHGEIVNDVSSDPRHQGETDCITALMCVPLKIKAVSIGAIALSRAQNQPYSAEDLKLLTTLSYQAAGVINALLHERQLKESRQNNLIFRLSSQIRNSLEPDAILATAVDEIYRALNLDRCCFLWHQTETRLQQLTTASQGFCLLPQFIGGLDVVTESKHVSLAPLVGVYDADTVGELADWFHQLMLVRVDNVHDLPAGTAQRFLQTHDFEAFLAIPIQTRSGQTGAICCGKRHEPRPWNDSEVALLKAVTNQLAIALDQAELYEHSQTAAHLAQDKAQQLEATLAALQQAQLQLVQSEKMSSIGQMVAGVAHEINNPVTFIHGNLSHLANYTRELIGLVQQYQAECKTPSAELQNDIRAIDLPFMLEDLPKTIRSMAVGTERIREIVLSLKNFSRLDQANFKAVDIHEGIDSTLLILRHRLKPHDTFPGVEIIQRYGALPAVQCYPGQLNQVFMNILANAIDALEESTQEAPTITIDTQQIAPNRIQIRIIDNGLGMSPDIQAKLFDPFFTTKEIGKGTGLGLSISYQIIT
ncbi:MAG: GAF domain-containing protein, partial [Cyanobacteria bacterium P01_A01_bin.114]